MSDRWRLECPRCTYARTNISRAMENEAWNELWHHVYSTHGNGTGRARSASAAGIMQTYRKVIIE